MKPLNDELHTLKKYYKEDKKTLLIFLQEELSTVNKKTNDKNILFDKIKTICSAKDIVNLYDLKNKEHNNIMRFKLLLYNTTLNTHVANKLLSIKYVNKNKNLSEEVLKFILKDNNLKNVINKINTYCHVNKTTSKEIVFNLLNKTLDNDILSYNVYNFYIRKEIIEDKKLCSENLLFRLHRNNKILKDMLNIYIENKIVLSETILKDFITIAYDDMKDKSTFNPIINTFFHYLKNTKCSNIENLIPNFGLYQSCYEKKIMIKKTKSNNKKISKKL